MAEIEKRGQSLADSIKYEELACGKLGVFVEHWRKASEPPKETGNYLVAIHFYEPIVALFIKDRGWYLDETAHIGLEESVKYWMPLPEPPRKLR